MLGLSWGRGDDSPAEDDPEGCVGGPNRVSLAQARRNVSAYGASEERLKRFVRPPFPDEHP
ncbi:CPCC family cysteine-rich protein [Streptomyces luteolus]|uniref:CPCC family cysteine-rich protein n=1 Tax=Streptomyces luteolus TaxID=3043615 RepID=UPI0038D04ACF